MEGGFFVWNNKRMIQLLKAGTVCYMMKAVKFYLYFYEKFKLGKKGLQNYFSAIIITLMTTVGENYTICYIAVENFAFIELYIFLEMETNRIEPSYTAFPLNSIS